MLMVLVQIVWCLSGFHKEKHSCLAYLSCSRSSNLHVFLSFALHRSVRSCCTHLLVHDRSGKTLRDTHQEKSKYNAKA